MGGSAIMSGFKARGENKSEKSDIEEIENLSSENNQISSEISKLNEMLQSGVLTQEEFEKAKKKILDN